MSFHSASGSGTPGQDFLQRVSLGLVPGVESEIKFGRNPDIDTGEEDLIEQGGSIYYPTAAQTLTISSDDTADTNTTGNGCWSVDVTGLNASYEEVTENVLLDGSNEVVTSTEFIRHYRMVCRGCGSTGQNEGTITAEYTDDEQTSVIILPGQGQSQFGGYTVPVGKKLLPLEILASIIKSTGGANATRAARFHIWIRAFNPTSTGNYECWRKIATNIMNQDGTSRVQNHLAVANVLPARADIRFSAEVTGDDTEITGRAQFLLIDV